MSDSLLIKVVINDVGMMSPHPRNSFLHLNLKDKKLRFSQSKGIMSFIAIINQGSIG